MKVSIQHDLPHDEFVKRFGAIAGAGYDQAHAALLRAQGIKPVTVATGYAVAAPEQPAAVVAAPAEAVPPVSEDLTQLYGLFVQLADAISNERDRMSALFIEQERALQALHQEIDNLKSRVSVIELIEVKTVDDSHASAA